MHTRQYDNVVWRTRSDYCFRSSNGYQSKNIHYKWWFCSYSWLFMDDNFELLELKNFQSIFPCYICALTVVILNIFMYYWAWYATWPRSSVGSLSGNRCESGCRSRGHLFNPGRVPYFRRDWSWNNFYGHSPPFHWIIQEGLLSVTSESMCTKYWLIACSSLPRKKCG